MRPLMTRNMRCARPKPVPIAADLFEFVLKFTPALKAWHLTSSATSPYLSPARIFRMAADISNTNDHRIVRFAPEELDHNRPDQLSHYYSPALDSSNCQNLGLSCRSWSSEIGNLLRKKKSLSEFLLRMQRTLMISAFLSK
jgi:hypothetical protein